MLRAMSTAIDNASRFDAMPNNVAFAVRASGRHGVNRTFEAVECHGPSRQRDAKCLVVLITADVTNGHIKAPFVGPWSW
jgi:hypothetical protein